MRRLLTWPIVSLMVTLPVIVLFLSQGILSLYATGVHPAALIVAGSVLAACASVMVWISIKRRSSATAASEVVDIVDTNPAWGTLQEQVWGDSCRHIDELLRSDERLESLVGHSVSVLRGVASHWNRAGAYLEYSATLPEALLATETLAARYRHVLLANIPFANRIKVSNLLSAWKLYERHEKTLKYGFLTYRVSRAFSVSGILSEISSLLWGQVKENELRNLEYNLKRAYLQEVASVAIDLYSGNFRRALDELPFGQDKTRDLERLAEKVGPLRIVIVGQVSSGKSTLTNMLLDTFSAEAGLLPTTASNTVYEFALSEGMDTHIVDTPGLEASSAAIDAALAGLMEADLVVWVMRANQPGRSIDKQLFDSFSSYFEQNAERQRPPVLVAATHIDCIPSFQDVNEATLQDVTVPLAEACRKAVQYDLFCPLSLRDPTLGLENLRAALVTLYERSANSRLNRIRLTQPSFYEAAAEELAHLRAGTIEAIKLALTEHKAR